MSATQYWLQLPDESGPIPVDVSDADLADRLGQLLGRGEHGETVTIRIAAAPDSDTAGHAAGSVAVTATLGDDVEGHALSLRFASPAQAIEFQKRLLVAGAIAATVAIGAVGAAAVSTSAPTAESQAGAAPAPAITITIDRPARSGPVERDPGPAIVAPVIAPATVDVAPEAAAGPSSTDFRQNAGEATTGGSSVQVDYPDEKDELLRNL